MDYHNEVLIESVSDLLKIINILNDKYIQEGKNFEPFYRGQSDFKEYSLNPSVFRDDNFLKEEHKMFNELKSVSPEEFDNHLTIFEQLTKMQHYGLPTRLLDITSNPLVALYFSCLSDYNKDGELFIISNLGINYSNSKNTRILSYLTTFNKNHGSTLSDFKNYIFDQKNSFNEISYRYIRETLNSEIIIRPNQRNKRLKNQNGAFIIFGNKFNEDDLKVINEKEISKIDIIKEPYDIKDKIISEAGERYRIPSKNKHSILIELSNLGINQSSLFPDLDKQANYIKKLYKSKASITMNDNSIENIIRNNKTGQNNNKYNKFKKSNLSMECRNYLSEKLNEYISENINNENKINNKTNKFIIELVDEYEAIIAPDLYTRKSTLAKIKIKIKRLLKKYDLIESISYNDLFEFFINLVQNETNQNI